MVTNANQLLSIFNSKSTHLHLLRIEGKNFKKIEGKKKKLFTFLSVIKEAGFTSRAGRSVCRRRIMIYVHTWLPQSM